MQNQNSYNQKKDRSTFMYGFNKSFPGFKKQQKQQRQKFNSYQSQQQGLKNQQDRKYK